jgi:formylglycine-generating enzyme required for sulfatase activity
MKKIERLAFSLLALTTVFCLQSCKDDIEVTTKTYQVTDVTTTSASIRGTITITSGDPEFIDAGICYSTTVTYPKITTSRYIHATGDLTDFVVTLTGLSTDSIYRFRAYASTSDTTYYGTTYSFKPAHVYIEKILVNGGTFTMGATEEQSGYATDSEKPAHSVTLDSYYIGKYEVTNKQFAIFLNSRQVSSAGSSMTTNGSSYKLIYTSPKGLYYDTDSSAWLIPAGYENLAVVNVTWYGANEFCLWAGGRLLTEAEWEFAARGGKNSKGYIYSGGNDVSEVGWYEPDLYNRDDLNYYTQPGGGKKANELGIFDMSGNVWEWCSDWYDSYASAAQTNPTGPTDDEAEADDSEIIYKVRRGGGWADPNATSLRVSNRAYNMPAANGGSIGFRYGE